jgi:phage host-nuclease inhibitor protein Gam
MVQGTIGFRLGTPKLLTIARKKWDLILDTIRGMDLPSYIRTKEEVNKEAILSDYGQDLISDTTMRQIGVQVVQEESFYVEPKLQDLANRQTTEAS